MSQKSSPKHHVTKQRLLKFSIMQELLFSLPLSPDPTPKPDKRLLVKFDEKPLNANAELVPISKDIYALKFEYNPLSFLCENSIIWFKNGDKFDIYRLTETLPTSNPEQEKSSIQEIENFLHH